MLEKSGPDLPRLLARAYSALASLCTVVSWRTEMVGRAVTQDKARQAELQLENGFLVFEVGLLFLIFPNVLM